MFLFVKLIYYNYIIGSHDSFSYTITPHSKLGPDASSLVKYLNRLLGPVMRRFVYKWSITQKCDIQFQLRLGIRLVLCIMVVYVFYISQLFL